MKHLIKISLLTFLQITFSISSLLSQQGWSVINTTFGGDVYFKDVNTGLVSLFKTTNGGLNWVYTGGGGYMSFPNQNTGYATGSGYIYKTTNFGDNWITQQNPVPGNLYGISFPTVNTGYACGGNYIIKTTNGGNNWIVINSGFYNHKAIFFTDTINGYVAGFYTDTSYIFRTTNGGLNWSIRFFTGLNYVLQSLFFVNANTGISGGFGYLFKTTNAGLNWSEITSPSLNAIYSLYFPSSNVGYGACTYGDIIKTTDGGWTWFRQTPVTGNLLYSVFFINDNTGYASGTNAVLKTTNGGGPPIGIKPISSELPDKFTLSQNYPNPFNPITEINYSIPKDVKVTIKIYDILGREVKILVDEFKPAGYYNVTFDASDLSSGVYFYKIEAGDFTNIKKMAVIK